MKRIKDYQPNNLNLFEQNQVEDTSKKKYLKKILYNKVFRISFIIIAIAFVLIIYLIANKESEEGHVSENMVLNVPIDAPEVEILDGTSNKKAAQYLMNLIRAEGFDVVELRKNGEGEVEYTYILDRSGKWEDAQKLAEIIGVPKNKVFRKIEPQLYLDISVVLGKDFKSLKIFKSKSEREKN